ncbi:MAG: purine-nucleoside phosphorylase, partial [Rikenellaceae bacterium]
LITDHINFIPNPLIGLNIEEFGVRFPAMTNAYSRRLREKAWQSAMEFRSGVYAAMTGPSYETPAEINFLRTIGADAVGMSTVPEVIVARHLGMEVFGVSVITNLATDSAVALHEDVMEIGNKAAEKMEELFKYIIENIT